jgi:hypothetical protein
MSGECKKCGEHTLQCTCTIYDQFQEILSKLSESDLRNLPTNDSKKNPTTEWISVEDCLPPDLQDVIVVDKEGNYTTANYFNEYDLDDCWMHSFPIDRDHENSFGPSYYVTNITHWMELPKGPEKSKRIPANKKDENHALEMTFPEIPCC